ncbi:MAG: hypothetical protein ACTSQG_02755 [Promethearchaeota archaeon]
MSKQKNIVYEDKTYIIVQFTTPKYRYYECYNKKTNVNNRMYSPSTIIGVLDKPALVAWSANTTAEYLADKLEDVRSGKLILSRANVPEIVRDAKYHYNKLKREAGDDGTRVHEAIKLYLAKGKYKEKLTTNNSIRGFNAFIRWKKTNKFEIIKSELPVWSIKEMCAGTLDAIANITEDKKKFLTLIDFKTSGDVYESHKLQLSFYAKAWEEMTEKRLDKFILLRLDKETGIPYQHLFTREEIEHEFKKFRCLRDYYYLNKQGVQK